MSDIGATWQMVMAHRWEKPGTPFALRTSMQPRHVFSFALGLLSVPLASPTLSFAESAPIPFGFTTIRGGANHHDESRAVAFAPNGGVCAVGKTAGGMPTTDSTVVTASGAGAGTAAPTDVWLACWSQTGALQWSTVFGGGGYDAGYAIAIDNTGIYVGGRAGMGLPTSAGVVQAEFAGDSAPSTEFGAQDGFIAKYDLGGQRLWVSYLGDSSGSFVHDLAVDRTGAVYAVLTDVRANNALVTAGAAIAARPGGADAVVAKFNANGALVWGSYLGGSKDDLAAPSLAVNDAGEVYVVGSGNSTNFPTTPGASQASFHGGATDLTLTIFAADGKSLVNSTYFGGSGADTTHGHNIAITFNGVYISGETTSSDLPVSGVKDYAGATDLLLVRFTSAGAYLGCTYLGGSNSETAAGLAATSDGNLVITGSTTSTDIPQTIVDWRGAGSDGYIAVVDWTLQQVPFGARIGGSGSDDILAAAAGSDGYAVVGSSSSTDFRTSDGSVHSGPTSGDAGRDAVVLLSPYGASGYNKDGYCEGYFATDAPGNGLDTPVTGCVGCASGAPTTSDGLVLIVTALMLQRRRRNAGRVGHKGTH